MRILLISLPGGQGTDEPLFPLGIGYLVAVLKKEHQVKVAHYQKFEHVDLTLPNLINSFGPDLVGLTCTTFNRGNVRKVVSVIKKYCPHIKVVIGGVHASFLPEQMLNGYGADFVVVGEGEYTALELCRALENRTSLDDIKGIVFKRAGDVIVTPPRPPIENLDELPMPDYDFAAHLMKISGMGFIITSRGCPVRCIFCSTSSYWGQKVRKTSVTRVVDEMEYLIDRYGIRKIFFHDDTFNLGVERVKQICNEIMRRKINIEWAVDCRVTPASQEMVDLMSEAGCRHICWGVETGSETMLKSIEKKITLDQIRNAYEFTKKHYRNMSSGAFAMVGNLGENDKTVRETIEFFNTIPLTDHPSTATLNLLPGTKIYFDMKSRGLVDDSIWLHNDDIPRTGEHSEAMLNRWAQMVSNSGNMLPFDKTKHFWNNVLFGDIPKPQVPRFIIDQSESQCKAAYNTNKSSPVEKLNVNSQSVLPYGNNNSELAVNFFTIVLNGEPFIRYHIDVFKQLPFKWHWHIVEGVAELKYDTAWSLKTGGRISSELHHNGRSNDGTTGYLDELARQYPENVTVYRKSEGVFWDGKLEMVNAPLANIRQQCLLWQVDSDELWTAEQIEKMRYLFLQYPDRTAAYFHCDYFLGPKKYVSSLNTWATYPKDWIRVWRFEPGMRWASHEPPVMVDSQSRNIGEKAPFTRDETKYCGITFQHFAYVTEAQVRFKEVYYGYKDAVGNWKRLQQTTGPVNPANYLPWAKNDATVDDWPGSKGILLGERLLKMQKSPRAKHLKVAGEYHASENLMKVATESEFAKAVKELFARIQPRKIIETGTYLGTGTTTIIAEALKQIGICDAIFCTIEVNPEYHAQAKKYFQQNNIEVFALNGLSVPRSMLPTREDIERMTITDVQYGDIFVDHREQNRAEFYQRETDFPNVPDNLLYKSLEVFNFKPDFVLLDSAGHMGFVEFKYLLENLKGACYIALDDTNHVKHYKSVQHIQQDPRFEIVISSKEKFGFCIARFVPASQRFERI